MTSGRRKDLTRHQAEPRGFAGRLACLIPEPDTSRTRPPRLYPAPETGTSLNTRAGARRQLRAPAVAAGNTGGPPRRSRGLLLTPDGTEPRGRPSC